MTVLFEVQEENLFIKNCAKILKWLDSHNIKYELTQGQIGELDLVCLINNKLHVISIYPFSKSVEQQIRNVYKSPRQYMRNKLFKINQEGISIVQFFEDEISFKLNIVLSVIKNKLGYSKLICGARECSISEISSTIANSFLDSNHIHGRNYGKKIDIGAFYNGQLVGLMSFRRGNLSRNSTDLEMDRFCAITNSTVPGLASKLFKFFIRNYEHDKVITYADLRFTTGNVYDILGFKFEKYTQTNYFYIVNNRRIHRFSYRKSLLPKKLKIFDPTKTEYENMLINGIDRVWDCGHKKFIFTKSNN